MLWGRDPRWLMPPPVLLLVLVQVLPLSSSEIIEPDANPKEPDEDLKSSDAGIVLLVARALGDGTDELSLGLGFLRYWEGLGAACWAPTTAMREAHWPMAEETKAMNNEAPNRRAQPAGAFSMQPYLLRSYVRSSRGLLRTT